MKRDETGGTGGLVEERNDLEWNRRAGSCFYPSD